VPSSAWQDPFAKPLNLVRFTTLEVQVWWGGRGPKKGGPRPPVPGRGRVVTRLSDTYDEDVHFKDAYVVRQDLCSPHMLDRITGWQVDAVYAPSHAHLNARPRLLTSQFNPSDCFAKLISDF
jgi:hypothetical protein